VPFNVVRAGEIIGHQHLPLEDAEHDLGLIKPRGVHRQPMDADLEGQAARENPGRQLPRRMGGTVVEDEMKDPDPSAPEAGEEHLQERLKFTEALAFNAARQGLPLVDQQAGKQLHRPFAVVPVAYTHGEAVASGDCAALGLPGLNRGLLVRADDDVALPAQALRPLMQLQDGNGLLQKPGISRLLPAAILPGFDLVRLEPALRSRGGDVRDDAALDHSASELARGRARQRFTGVARQGAGESGYSGADRGGKKSVARLTAGRLDTPALPASGCATYVPSGRYSPRPGQSPRYSTRDAPRPAGGSWPVRPPVGGGPKAADALELWVFRSGKSDAALRFRSPTSRGLSTHRSLKSDDIVAGDRTVDPSTKVIIVKL